MRVCWIRTTIKLMSSCNSVHFGKITKGSESRFVIVKLYDQKLTMTNIQQEVAKLR